MGQWICRVTPPPNAAPPRHRWLWWSFQLVATTGLWFGVLFGGAGRFNWPRGWIYAVTYLGSMTAIAVMVRRRNPGLFEARANWRHHDTKRFDKILLAFFYPLFLLQPGLAALDNARFRWWLLPFSAVYPGLLLLAVAALLVAWALAVNPFAESTVRIQTERGHTVVSAGPYRFVRHPMYVGAILLSLAPPLILGSMWALILGIVIAILLIARTALEDRALRRELPGYEEYAARTRYRLLPGVW
jgi:protein-S-isoprenylcysteine O-methyltransferase Ste14